MPQIIDGKKISETIQQEIAEEVRKIQEQGGKVPHLVAVLVGNDEASETYVNSKVKTCEKIGFGSGLIRLPESTTEGELLAKVHELNNDPQVDGFIVQLPLPKHISEQKIIEAIDPKKDVDGFHPTNVGRMVLNLPAFLPATPYGVLQLLERSGIKTSGKHCVVIGRSHIVGSPMSILMARNTEPGNCTVTICHSKTQDLKEHTLRADILIVAIGRPNYVTADMVKEGAVVIDVGMHRIPDSSKKSGFRLTGDVAYDEVVPKCSYISPVPGGVGPMTIVSLLMNTLRSAKKEIYN